MSHSCLDQLGALPTLDVVAICARDAADLATLRAHGAVAGFGTADALDGLMLLGAALAGAVVLLRLAAFLHVVGRACGSALRQLRRPEPRTLVERHRGRPAANICEPGRASRDGTRGRPMP